jgi:SAM-dependent methyltransferase
MSGGHADNNLQTYDTPTVASHYAVLDYLTPCERLLFDSFIKPGSAVLDLGVGGGRTTPYLASPASRYVGADYAPAMVKACQAKFPGLEFRVADAADLSAFQDGAFDVVVFAFNGLDYVFPAESRHACLRHTHRILKPNGFLIFSSHNPRAVVVRRRWNRERLQRLARRFSGGWGPLYNLLLVGFSDVRSVLAVGQSAWATLMRLRRILSRAFWRGEGHLVDSAHRGLFTHYWIPERVIDELDHAHFRVERVLGDDYPQASHHYTTDWYYYVFAKR